MVASAANQVGLLAMSPQMRSLARGPPIARIAVRTVSQERPRQRNRSSAAFAVDTALGWHCPPAQLTPRSTPSRRSE
jgi:hypothetical protein